MAHGSYFASPGADSVQIERKIIRLCSKARRDLAKKGLTWDEESEHHPSWMNSICNHCHSKVLGLTSGVGGWMYVQRDM